MMAWTEKHQMAMNEEWLRIRSYRDQRKESNAAAI
jgi:hypothetical protein